jgi:hypothetical protein
MSVADKLADLALAAAEAAAAMRGMPVAAVPPPAEENPRASASASASAAAASAAHVGQRRPGSMFEHLSPEELSSQLESERSKWVQVGVEGDTIPVREGMRFRYGVVGCSAGTTLWWWACSWSVLCCSPP